LRKAVEGLEYVERQNGERGAEQDEEAAPASWGMT
jgi:hypothetical protein